MPANKRDILSDLKKVDAHVIQPHEYDEAPEWTDEEFASAMLTRRGTPVDDIVEIDVKLRLAPDIVDLYKATGPEWQTPMQDDIAKATRRLKAS